MACVVGGREDIMEGLVSPADDREGPGLCSRVEHVLHWARQVQVQQKDVSKECAVF